MHLQRKVKIQFAAFVVIAVVSMSVLAVSYGRIGATVFGFGQYTVTVDLPESAGLYDRANVTYQGTNVGRVTDVAVTDSGVEAHLALTSDVAIPSDVIAEVHSQSAVGEQYLALRPLDLNSPALRAGAVIPMDRTSVPPDIGDQLDMTARALEAIPKDDLKTVIDESYLATGGLGPELTRLLDASMNLAIDTRKHLADVTNVIDNSAPILNSQVTTRDDVTAWAQHLAAITGQLRDNDPAVSALLHNAAPAADQARALFERLDPSVPIMLASLVGLADVGVVYNPNVEQILVLMPQNMSQLGAAVVTNMNTKTDYRGSTQQAVLSINLPPPCLTGYLPPQQWRSPSFQDFPERPPGDFYCRIPQDSTNAVRGARNIPCAGKPWKRAPTVWMCESDEEYVPLNEGYNWKGDANATLSGQGVPQLSPLESGDTPQGSGTEIPAVAAQVPASPDGRPPVTTPPGALGLADYNPVDGTYLGPDGEVYTQRDLAGAAAPPSLQSMLFPPEYVK